MSFSYMGFHFKWELSNNVLIALHLVAESTNFKSFGPDNVPTSPILNFQTLHPLKRSILGFKLALTKVGPGCGCTDLFLENRSNKLTLVEEECDFNDPRFIVLFASVGYSLLCLVVTGVIQKESGKKLRLVLLVLLPCIAVCVSV